MSSTRCAGIPIHCEEGLPEVTILNTIESLGVVDKTEKGIPFEFSAFLNNMPNVRYVVSV